MRLILIRHAESRHIIEKIIAVRSACPGLTETGFAQARALAVYEASLEPGRHEGHLRKEYEKLQERIQAKP